MNSVLIVSNTSSTLGIISELLKFQTFSCIVAAQNGGEARRQIAENEFELIIIDAPLSDEAGDDFALYASQATSSGIILITNVETLYDMSALVEEAGIFTLPKPMSPELFYQAVKMLYASRKRLLKYQKENIKLQTKIHEIQIIDRAKYTLMQYLNMTEAQAHRYIERQSMDLRQSRLVTAENVLKTYET